MSRMSLKSVAAYRAVELGWEVHDITLFKGIVGKNAMGTLSLSVLCDSVRGELAERPDVYDAADIRDVIDQQLYAVEGFMVLEAIWDEDEYAS